MRKTAILLLCLSLAGILLLSACNGSQAKTQAAEPGASPTLDKSPTPPAPTATATKLARATQTKVGPTKTIRPSQTPTGTSDVDPAVLVVEIDQLINNLFTDLADTDIIRETEIP